MIVLRLEKLCRAKCDRMALALAARTLRAIAAIDQPGQAHLRLVTSNSQYNYIFDLYLALLMRLRHPAECINEVNTNKINAGICCYRYK